MRRRVEPVARQRILPRERLFVRQQQRLMAGIELRSFELRHGVGIDPARVHEIERFTDPVGKVAILLGPGAPTHEIVRPGVNLMQVRIAATRKRAQQVQRRRRLVISLYHALWVRRATFRFERNVVDDVAAVRWQLHIVDRLGIGTARFGELARHTAEFDRRQLRREGEYNRHLQKDAERVTDVVGMKFGKGFRAIATLQQKGLAASDAREFGSQIARLTGKDQRWKIAERRRRARKSVRIGVSRELARFVRCPAGGVPFDCHSVAALRQRCINCNAARF